ncbi:alkaline phosphatase [Thalassotalea sp. M1531]|uniref:Alkaline phosphatase n=1 Tax=Thalassotalea algicola TaxID=2716224 RepID=A0A7Y0LBK3_9GAMM|nr:alkaline phosphatase [Thalassotalea algicola]NMP31545.1 alkaline phosphatase [Thalassotalea algicola]
MRKLALSLCLATSLNVAASQESHNIIMVVADGMGPAFTTGYRYFNDDKSTEQVEQTIFDKYQIGSASTYPAPVSGYVTDSAAGATALSTGIKSYNGAIAVDVNKQPIETVLERAKSYGMKTGAVVTSQVNHATPASYIVHNEHRRNYNDIADSYFIDRIEGQFKFDVLLGGGWLYFIRDERNLVEEFKQENVQYIDKYQQLSSLKKGKSAIGLFAEKGLPWALDDKNPHRLSALTNTATKLLDNSHGYFLLIEASQVDWAGHANDIASAMAEMDDLAKTMELLEGYVANNPNTTVILTADHSTGGLTLAAKGKYVWQPDILKLQKHSAEAITKQLITNEISPSLTNQLFNFELTKQEVNDLIIAKLKSEEQIAIYNALSSEQKKSAKKPRPNRIVGKAVTHIIDTRTNTGWTSGGHTAIDVPVIALGKHAEMFAGHQDNTDIAKKVFKLLEQYRQH